VSSFSRSLSETPWLLTEFLPSTFRSAAEGEDLNQFLTEFYEKALLKPETLKKVENRGRLFKAL
jgi:hypothetical protein